MSDVVPVSTAAPAAITTPVAAPAVTDTPLPSTTATPTAESASQSAATILDQAATQQAVSTGQTTEPAATNAEGSTKTEGDKPQGAPEKYEFKPIEGVNLDPSVVGKFSEVAKELNLPQEAAQKVLDQVAPAIAAQQQAAIEAASNQWVAEVKADKEFGGEKLEANLAVAKKARDAFSTPELRTLLQETRLGNNPEVIRFFYKVGLAMSEDKFVPGGKQAATPMQSQADILYGKK